MKRILIPAVFVIALAGSAFTRFSTTSSKNAKSSMIGYYQDYTGMCQAWEIDDYNCVADDLGYLCYENIEGLGWAVMLQYEFGNTCYQPYYSYYSNM